MNGPTHNDQQVLELLNSSIDGELSAAEQSELDALLARSESVRAQYAELNDLAGILDGAPELDPPQYLHNAIVSQVRLPVSADDKQIQKAGLISQWLAAPMMRTGLAVAAGVLLTVGIYQTGTESLSIEDEARMTGTVLKTPDAVLLDSTSFDAGTMQGTAQLSSKNGLLLVDISLQSAGTTLVDLGFSGQSFELVSVTGLEEKTDHITVSDHLVRVTGSGSLNYGLLLRNTADLENAKLNPLTLAFFADSKLVHEAELESVQ